MGLRAHLAPHLKALTMTYKPLDPIAFLIAFVTAPVVFTVMYFWVLFLPLIAFVGGFLPYLIFGLPLMLWFLLFNAPDEDALHSFTLKAVICIGCFGMGLTFATGHETLFGVALWGTAFGAVFGPLWAVQFCRIYLKLAHRSDP